MKQVTNGKCPVCGGTSFVARRTKKGVVTAGLLAPKRVRCVSCGESLTPGSGISAPTSVMDEARLQPARAAVAEARARLEAEQVRRTAAGDPPPRKPRLMTVKSIQRHAREHAEWVARGRVEESRSGGTAEEHREELGEVGLDRGVIHTPEGAGRQRQSVSGAASTAAAPDVTDQLRKLGELRDAGVLTEDEFSAKKADLLARM